MQFTKFFGYALSLFFALNGISSQAAASTKSSHHESEPNDLKLTDALSRPSLGPTNDSISCDGSKVYVTYNVTGTEGGIMAELFDNVNGKLITRETLTLDPNYPIVLGGFASPDFKRFSILDGVPTGPNSFDGRIRILDKNFNTLVERVISSTVGNFDFFTVTGGRFSDDGKYLSLAAGDGVAPNSSTDLYIFDSSTLDTVAFKTISHLNVGGPNFLTLEHHGKKRYYTTFGSCNGYFSPNFELTIQPPYFIEIYKIDFDNETLDFVDGSPLPKFALVSSTMSLGKKGLVSHGGFCSLFPNQLSIYDTNFLKTTSLPDDNAESRILEFDGKTLEVKFKQAVNCCNETVLYPPHKGRTALVAQNTVVTDPTDPNVQRLDPEFYVLATLGKKNGKKQWEPLNLPRQDVVGAISEFSHNGKWLVRTGNYGYFEGNPNVDSRGIHNVLLFKVLH